MTPTTPTLIGPTIRLEPLDSCHLPALEQVAFDDGLWRLTLHIVRNPAELRHWMDSALALRDAGSTLPWATVLNATGEAIGSTRFLDLDPRHRTVEIGNTWLGRDFQGTAINPEAKLLQLTYAFETLNLTRVALKTHHENVQSQAAMRKLGATYEGTFRNHYIMPDGSARHSVWFSITREDWPQVKLRLEARLRALRPSA